jgi:hypothetical protein
MGAKQEMGAKIALSLSLDQTRNISSNPGFEMFNGTFAKNLN